MNAPDLCQTQDFEEASFSSRSGEKYWIIHQVQFHTYLRLDERDHFLWALMDGNFLKNYQFLMIKQQILVQYAFRPMVSGFFLRLVG